jgi:hypothetical protein
MQAKLTRAVLCGLGSGTLMVLSLFGAKGIDGSAASTGAGTAPASGDVHGLKLAGDDCNCTAVGGVRG